MFQLPVNNLNSLRKARKNVKKALGDIGLEYCLDHAKDLKEFGPNEFYVKNTTWEDVCMWEPSSTKSQDYRSKPFCCTNCTFSSRVFSAYLSHFRNVHGNDYKSHILLNCHFCTYNGNKNALEVHVKLFHTSNNVLRQGVDKQAMKDVGISCQARPLEGAEQAVYYCKKCTYRDPLYNIVRKHIYREHFQHVAAPYIGRGPPDRSAYGEAKPAVVSGRSNALHCKRCLFVPRMIEGLIQHVIEDHERIGYQVTAMIGHAMMGRLTPSPLISSRTTAVGAEKRSVVAVGEGQTGVTTVRNSTPQQTNRVVPIGAGNKSGIFALKGGALQPLSTPPQVRITLPGTAQVSTPLTAKKFYQVDAGAGARRGLGASVSSSSLFSASSLPYRGQPKRVGGPPVNTAHTQKWKICTICNELFPENVYSAHFEKAHKAQKVRAVASYIMKIHNFTSKCLFCNRYLPSDTLLNHMLIHGLTCPTCLSTFNEVERLVAHARQVHSGEASTVDSRTDTPLTFDLTLQQGEPKNVQLVVTTYCNKVRNSPQDLAAVHAQNSVTADKRVPLKGETGQETGAVSKGMPQKMDMGKTLCPLCFTVLKGPISDSLAQHLRLRHQVIQTVHPVERKLTYKCIHCLGVYTSNMTASTITLHLVHCRGVGRAPNSLDMPFLSTTLPTHERDPIPDPTLTKRRKTEEHRVREAEEPVALALDPQRRQGDSYEEGKAFLTRYFQRQPYPSLREVERLASALRLWKSDVASYFTNRRRACMQDCRARKPMVLLGFNMRQMSQMRHNMSFHPVYLYRGQKVRESQHCESALSQQGKPKPSEPISPDAVRSGNYTEPIVLDEESGSEGEGERGNGGENTADSRTCKRDVINAGAEEVVGVANSLGSDDSSWQGGENRYREEDIGSFNRLDLGLVKSTVGVIEPDAALCLSPQQT
ncbi:hypothetical protein GJAV_G00175450 [Gymnothorax javanicus]|nr:hypothetical protein GJAV_G00175450 [Gymnothorax javanicus]